MTRYVTYSFHISDIISLEAANSATGSFLLIKTEKEEIKIEAESPKAAAAIAEELKNVMKWRTLEGKKSAAEARDFIKS